MMASFFRNTRVVQNLVGGLHHLAVHRDEAGHGRPRPGGQDDVAGCDRLGFAFIGADPDLPRTEKFPKAAGDIDVTTAKDGFKASHIGGDNLVLACHQAGQVDSQAFLSRKDGGRPGLGQKPGFMDEGFGGNTPPIEAGAAEFVFFDQQDAHPFLSTQDGGMVASRPATDDRQVIFCLTRGH